jgi:hypothetical protein
MSVDEEGLCVGLELSLDEGEGLGLCLSCRITSFGASCQASLSMKPRTLYLYHGLIRRDFDIPDEGSRAGKVGSDGKRCRTRGRGAVRKPFSMRFAIEATIEELLNMTL